MMKTLKATTKKKTSTTNTVNIEKCNIFKIRTLLLFFVILILKSIYIKKQTSLEEKEKKNYINHYHKKFFSLTYINFIS